MKNLIAYYSFSHNNEKLSRYLSEKLHCECARIETKKSRNGFSILLDLMFGRKPAVKPLPYSLAEYDHVIFVSPIWAGKIATPLRSLLEKEKNMINHYSFISLCGGLPGQKEKIEDQLVSIVGKKPDVHVELSINDLLPKHQRNTVKHTTGYRVEANELEVFEPQLQILFLKSSLIDAA